MPRATGAAPAKKAANPPPAATPAPVEPEETVNSLFATLDDVVDHLNILLYGREGSGKSTGAARLANAFSHLPEGKGKILVINAEGGFKKRPMQRRGVDISRIRIWPDPAKHERPTHSSLKKIARQMKSDLMEDPESWGGVVFDSATEGYQAMLDFAQQKRVASVKRTGKDVDEDFVDIADYGTMSKMFRDVLRELRDLPCHFVVTALERRTVDKDTGKPTYGPDVTPALQSDLLGYVDMVLMCKSEDEDGPFRALTRANGRYRAKDRFDVLPKVLVDPFADRIIKYVVGEYDMDEGNDPEQARLPAAKVAAKPKNEKEDDDNGDEVNPDETQD